MRIIVVEIVLSVVLAVVVGAGAGYWTRKKTAESQIGSAEEAAKKIIVDAERVGEAKKKEALLEAKEDIHKLRLELDRDTKERRVELQRLERRLMQKEENLDRKIDSLEKKEDIINKKEVELDKSQEEIHEIHEKQMAELERISSLTSE